MEYKVTAQSTLLEALALMAPDSSKTTLRSWLKLGRISVNGVKEVKATALVEPGATITLDGKPKASPLPFNILFEDSDLIVINKPAGLLSVKTHYDNELTAHALLKKYLKPSRVFPVHRLDRETSGVIVFALTEKARDSLKEQLKDHSVERVYMAVVSGIVPENQGTWKSYLYEDPNYFVHSTDDPSKGRLAITHFRVLERRKNSTLLQIQLETGRKNQIRVHASDAGFPILGDDKYGHSKKSPLGRLGLHACKLGFIHPITGKKLSFESEWDL